MDGEEVLRIIEQGEGLNIEHSKGGEPQLLEGDIFRIIIPLAPEEEADVGGKITGATTDKTTDNSEGWSERWSKRWSEKGISERQMQIIELIHENPRISRKEISEILGINQSAVQKHMETLKKKGVIRRVGPARGGHWEVVE